MTQRLLPPHCGFQTIADQYPSVSWEPRGYWQPEEYWNKTLAEISAYTKLIPPGVEDDLWERFANRLHLDLNKAYGLYGSFQAPDEALRSIGNAYITATIELSSNRILPHVVKSVPGIGPKSILRLNMVQWEWIVAKTIQAPEKIVREGGLTRYKVRALRNWIASWLSDEALAITELMAHDDGRSPFIHYNYF
jgi:hypothetical protein